MTVCSTSDMRETRRNKQKKKTPGVARNVAVCKRKPNQKRYPASMSVQVLTFDLTLFSLDTPVVPHSLRVGWQHACELKNSNTLLVVRCEVRTREVALVRSRQHTHTRPCDIKPRRDAKHGYVTLRKWPRDDQTSHDCTQLAVH